MSSVREKEPEDRDLSQVDQLPENRVPGTSVPTLGCSSSTPCSIQPPRALPRYEREGGIRPEKLRPSREKEREQCHNRRRRPGIEEACQNP